MDPGNSVSSGDTETGQWLPNSSRSVCSSGMTNGHHRRGPPLVASEQLRGYRRPCPWHPTCDVWEYFKKMLKLFAIIGRKLLVFNFFSSF